MPRGSPKRSSSPPRRQAPPSTGTGIGLTPSPRQQSVRLVEYSDRGTSSNRHGLHPVVASSPSLSSATPSHSNSLVSTIPTRHGISPSHNINPSQSNRLLLLATNESDSGGNPYVQAIQSRVDELVRRYDESSVDRSWGRRRRRRPGASGMPESELGIDDDEEDDDDDDDDDSYSRAPQHWRVGDVLLATHAALAATSTRTARAMTTEFPDQDDAEVMAALGQGEAAMSKAMADAVRQTTATRTVLARSLELVQYMQQHDVGAAWARRGMVDDDDGKEEDAEADAALSASHLRDLKLTVAALRKEKTMLLTQMQEQNRAHREMLAVTDAQHQELTKVQIALAMKQDELVATREDHAQRIQELSRSADSAAQSAASFRERQASADARHHELEQKLKAAQSELVKHDVVLRAMQQDTDRARDKLKESEEKRVRAETALHEAQEALTEATAAAAQAAVSASEGKTKRMANDNDNGWRREKQELESRLSSQDAAIRALQRELQDATHGRTQFESDHAELTLMVRDLRARVQSAEASKPGPEPRPGSAASNHGNGASMTAVVPLRQASALQLSFRRQKSQRNAVKKRSVQQLDAIQDDLSSSSDSDDEAEEHEEEEEEEEEEEAKDAAARKVNGDALEECDSEEQADRAMAEKRVQATERQLNAAMQQAMAAAFPIHESALSSHSDESLASSIVRFEAKPTSSVPPTNTTFIGDNESSELDKMRLAFESQLAQMKQTYVSGLLEYKALVIEQYERRRAEVQQHHRDEIERVLRIVQQEFRAELARRSDQMRQAKDSLKALYRVLNMDRPVSSNQSSGLPATNLLVPSIPEHSLDSDDEETDERKKPTSNGGHAPLAGDGSMREPVPIKLLLRAAVFAMSTSRRRNDEANADITAIYENVTRTLTEGYRAAADGNSEATRQPQQLKTPPSMRETLGAMDTSSPVPGNGAAMDWDTFLRERRAHRDAQLRRSSQAAKKGVVHVASQVDEDDFVIYQLRGLRDAVRPPEDVSAYVVPSIALGNGNGHNHGHDHDHVDSPRLREEADSGVLYLTAGARISQAVMRELHAVLPFLPRDAAFYLSAALRHRLLLEMLRFYSALRDDHVSSPSAPVRGFIKPATMQQQQQRMADGSDIVVVLGSPRNTPFMRRKALEGVAAAQRRRTPLISGGPPSSSSSGSAPSSLSLAGMMSLTPPHYPRKSLNQG